jgi:hypothetical protein
LDNKIAFTGEKNKEKRNEEKKKWNGTRKEGRKERKTLGREEVKKVVGREAGRE